MDGTTETQSDAASASKRTAWTLVRDRLLAHRAAATLSGTLAVGLAAAATAAAAVSPNAASHSMLPRSGAGTIPPAALTNAALGNPWAANGILSSAQAAGKDPNLHDYGPASPNAHAEVSVYLLLRNMNQAYQFVQAVSDPTNPLYGHYVTPAQFRAYFAPTNATAGMFHHYFRSFGLTLLPEAANHHMISASGKVKQMEKALQVKIHSYVWTDPNSGTQYPFMAPTTNPKLPRQLSHYVASIGGINEGTFAHTNIATAPPGHAFRDATPCSNYWGEQTDPTLPVFNGVNAPFDVCGYTPAQMQSAYGINTLQAQGINGAGQTVAIIDAYASPTFKSDMTQYAAAHGLPAFAPGQLTEKLMSKGLYNVPEKGQCDPQGWYEEQSLDGEAVHTTAPGANILYVGANGCQDGQLENAVNTVVDNHLADVVTNSWSETGEPNPSTATAWDEVWLQAAAEGMSVMFSSGDEGDNMSTGYFRRPAVDYPGSSPLVTAVGGTSVGIDQNGQYAFETGWGTYKGDLLAAGAAGPGYPAEWVNPTFDYGAGGGQSALYFQPGYQQGVVPASFATDPWGHVVRSTPDIAGPADPNLGFLIGVTQTMPDGKAVYNEFRIGGTSEASPFEAGVIADANQVAGHPHGLLNPALYRMAGTGAFRDVVPPTSPLAMVNVSFVDQVDNLAGLTTSIRTLNQDSSLITAPGWDNVTGLGTPNAPNFVQELGH